MPTNWERHFDQFFPKLVVPSYGVSFTYVFFDTYDKASKANVATKGDGTAIAEAAVDTLLWQSFASVIIPGFVIHTVVDVASAGTNSKALGANCFGFICHTFNYTPIDHFVDWAMDSTVRPFIAGLKSKS